MLTINNIEASQQKLRWVLERFHSDLGIGSRDVIRQQAGLLIKELATEEIPNSPGWTGNAIERRITRVFAPRNPNWSSRIVNEQANWGKGEKKHEYGDWVWLNAGPKYLMGTKKGNYQLGSTSEAMGLILRANPNGLGKRHVASGVRGQQRITMLNRIVVGRGVYKKFVKEQRAAVGKLKASFAKAWAFLAPKGRLPKIAMRHIDDAKGSFINGLDTPGKPTFTIISNASGCEHPKSTAVIVKVLRFRTIKATAYLARMIRLRKADNNED